MLCGLLRLSRRLVCTGLWLICLLTISRRRSLIVLIVLIVLVVLVALVTLPILIGRIVLIVLIGWILPICRSTRISLLPCIGHSAIFFPLGENHKRHNDGEENGKDKQRYSTARICRFIEPVECKIIEDQKRNIDQSAQQRHNAAACQQIGCAITSIVIRIL